MTDTLAMISFVRGRTRDPFYADPVDVHPSVVQTFAMFAGRLLLQGLGLDDQDDADEQGFCLGDDGSLEMVIRKGEMEGVFRVPPDMWRPVVIN